MKDGKLVKVEGDPEHPVTKGRLCVRCLSLEEYVNHPDRLLYPLKRAKEDRGKDKFERITWDEAYATIKEETEKIWAKYGKQSVVNFEGTGRLACMLGHLRTDVAFQTPNFAYTQSGWSCYGPRCAVSNYILGASMIELDFAATYPDSYDNPGFELPEYIVLWGKEPLKSNPDGFFGHSVIDMMQRGSKLIMIDPRMNWLATRAEHVLRLRPGTDTALGMALLYVIISEDLYDHDFVENWVFGWDEFSARILDGHTPEWAEEITWVPAEQIREVARTIANAHPVNFGWGLAMDQNVNGVQAAQCFIALLTITGNLDIPGGTTLGVKDWNIKASIGAFQEYIPKDLMKKRIGAFEYPAVNFSVDTAHPDMLLECLETDEPYPIRMAWISSSNLISPTNSSQPERWHKALQKMEFVVFTDTFHNPMSMAFADIVLPIATFAEFDYYVLPNYGYCSAFIGAINKALDVGECRSEFDISLDMVKLLNPDVDLPFKNLQEFLDSNVGANPGLTGFNDLKEMVVYQPEVKYKKYETGLARPDGKPGFNTPSGKVELYASVYEMFGDDPLPYYEEPRWSNISRPEYKDKYPLILTTGQRNYTSFHSEHRQIRSLRRITPDPIVEIHPETAKERGIEDGDWCYVENMFGKCKLKAQVTPIVDRRVVAATHGWWFPEDDPEEPSLFGVWKANVNSLIPTHDIGKMGFGAPYKSMVCDVYKVEE